MRILFVSHYQLPHVGGIETLVDGLARELSRRGHELTVVSSDAGGAGTVAPAPYREIRVPAYNGLERRLGVPYPLFSPRLIAVLRREVRHADVVHAQGYLYKSTLLAFAAARHHGRIRVLTEHVGHVPYRPLLLNAAQRAAAATIGRWTARSADALVLLNEHVRAEVGALAPGTIVAPIPNGTDLDRFRPAEPGERERLRAQLGWNGEPRVLFVGRPVAKKGFDLAVEAARRADGAFRLVVAGPDALPPGTPESTELLGLMPPARLAELFRACDAIVLPSATGEGLPLTTHEAMASALPVVMTDDPGYRNLVAPAGPALRLVDRDPALFATALSEVVQSPPEALDALVAFARERFSWQRVGDEHEALYRRLGAP